MYETHKRLQKQGKPLRQSNAMQRLRTATMWLLLALRNSLVGGAGVVSAQSSSTTEIVISEGGFDAGVNMRCSSAAGTAGFLLIVPNSFANYSISSGRCLYHLPVNLLTANNHPTGKKAVSSFSTTFTFSIDGRHQNEVYPISPILVPGFAFIMVADSNPATNEAETGNPEQVQYLGILNATSDNHNASHTFAVEIDVYNPKIPTMFNDPPQDHVGIDLNSMNSSYLHEAGFFRNVCVGSSVVEKFFSINLTSGTVIQAWIDYEGVDETLTVTLGPNLGSKPSKPLLNQSGVDLSFIIEENMYLGFSFAGVGSEFNVPAFLYAWSFNTSGPAELDFSSAQTATLDSTDLSNCTAIPPPRPENSSNKSTILLITLPTSLGVLLLLAIAVGCYLQREKKALQKKYRLIEMEELEYGPIKYSLKALRGATNGFDPKRILGSGAFGTVFVGVLPGSGSTVAVKRMAANSPQSEREFIAEVRIIGRLRHRNLVQLAGWCREKGELLLVYEYMPNGSLDRYIFKSGVDNNDALQWTTRLDILIDVATALLYLHEEWEQRVVHRDVKASNVLLDSAFKARLGDFGLARSHQHSEEAASTMVAGTPGYLAPEATQTNRATSGADVYSFGVVALEVVSGRRAVDNARPADEAILVKWVWHLQAVDRLHDAIDVRLGQKNFVKEQVLIVLKIGLLCTQDAPDARPSMRRVLQYLKLEAPLPHLPSMSMQERGRSRP